MKWILHSLVASLLILGAFNQSTPVSYFRNMKFIPYEMTKTYGFDLEFAYPSGGNMTLDVRLSNATYDRALVLGLNVTNATLVRLPVTIFSYLFDASGSFMLYFRAYHNQFESTLQLRVYERETKSYGVTDDLFTVGSNKPTAEVNANGVVIYRHETLTLLGFTSLIVEPYYYAMHFRYWSLSNNHSWKANMMIYPTLRIESRHPAFTLIDQPRRINKLLSLQFEPKDNLMASSLNQSLYVDPETLYPSSIHYESFIETDLLFLPLNDFATLNTIRFVMVINIQAIHVYALTYAFTYETLKPLIGPCHLARYCVGVNA